MKYRIIITEVTETETEETATKYFCAKKGKWLDWSAWYHLSGDEQKEFEEMTVTTGKTSVIERKKDIYTQDKEGLDVAELALFINRTR